VSPSGACRTENLRIAIASPSLPGEAEFLAISSDWRSSCFVNGSFSVYVSVYLLWLSSVSSHAGIGPGFGPVFPRWLWKWSLTISFTFVGSVVSVTLSPSVCAIVVMFSCEVWRLKFFESFVLWVQFYSAIALLDLAVCV
jgi:hypothetical protein